MSRSAISGGFALALIMLAPAAHATSFDCARASTLDERAVCGSPRLSNLDDLLGSAFAQLRQGPNARAAQQTARDFLAARRACGANEECIAAAYGRVLQDLRTLGAGGTVPSPTPQGRLPTRIGQCVHTQVVEVTPRLDPGHPPPWRNDEFDTGTAIDFSNGGFQVSYDREPELLRSRPGDQALMCLVSVPQDCPPGDDRGKVYTVTNLRTQGSWTLPDSQHACGGA